MKHSQPKLHISGKREGEKPDEFCHSFEQSSLVNVGFEPQRKVVDEAIAKSEQRLKLFISDWPEEKSVKFTVDRDSSLERSDGRRTRVRRLSTGRRQSSSLFTLLIR